MGVVSAGQSRSHLSDIVMSRDNATASSAKRCGSLSVNTTTCKTGMFSERKLSPTELPAAVIQKKGSVSLTPNAHIIDEHLNSRPVSQSQVELVEKNVKGMERTGSISPLDQINWSLKNDKEMQKISERESRISKQDGGLHGSAMKEEVSAARNRGRSEEYEGKEKCGILNKSSKAVGNQYEMQVGMEKESKTSPKRNENGKVGNELKESKREDRAISAMCPATRAKSKMTADIEEKSKSQHRPVFEDKRDNQRDYIDLKEQRRDVVSTSPTAPAKTVQSNTREVERSKGPTDRSPSAKHSVRSKYNEPNSDEKQKNRLTRKDNNSEKYESNNSESQKERRRLNERGASSPTRPLTQQKKSEKAKGTTVRPKEYPESEDDEPRNGPLQYGTISNNQARNLEKLYQEHDRFPTNKAVRKFASSFHLSIIDVEIWLETRRELTYRRFVKQGLEMEASVIKFYSEAMKMAEGIRLEQPSIRSRAFFSLEGVSEIEAKKDKEEQSQPFLTVSTNKIFVSGDKKEKCQIVIKNAGQTNIVYQLSMINSENYIMSPLCAILHEDEELTLNITRKKGPLKEQEFFRVEYGVNPDGLIDAREAANRAEMLGCEIVEVVAIDEGEMKIIR